MILDGSPKGEKARGLNGNTEGPTPEGAFNRGCPRNCRRRVSAPRMPLGNREGGGKTKNRKPGDLPSKIIANLRDGGFRRGGENRSGEDQTDKPQRRL